MRSGLLFSRRRISGTCGNLLMPWKVGCYFLDIAKKFNFILLGLNCNYHIEKFLVSIKYV